MIYSTSAPVSTLAGEILPDTGYHTRLLTWLGVPVGQLALAWVEGGGGITHRRMDLWHL